MPSHRQSLAVAAAAILAFVEASPVAIQQRSPNPQYLAKRSFTGVACGLFSTGAGKDIAENLRIIQGQSDGTADVPGHMCSRMACTNTSGAYLCNDNDDDISVPLSEVAEYLATADTYCRPSSGVPDDDVMSGQVFTDGNYNVEIAYADCNHDPLSTNGAAQYNIAPVNTYHFKSGGPNGIPNVICGGNSRMSHPLT